MPAGQEPKELCNSPSPPPPRQVQIDLRRLSKEKGRNFVSKGELLSTSKKKGGRAGTAPPCHACQSAAIQRTSPLGRQRWGAHTAVQAVDAFGYLGVGRVGGAQLRLGTVAVCLQKCAAYVPDMCIRLRVDENSNCILHNRSHDLPRAGTGTEHISSVALSTKEESVLRKNVLTRAELRTRGMEQGTEGWRAVRGHWGPGTPPSRRSAACRWPVGGRAAWCGTMPAPGRRSRRRPGRSTLGASRGPFVDVGWKGAEQRIFRPGGNSGRGRGRVCPPPKHLQRQNPRNPTKPDKKNRHQHQNLKCG